MLPVSHPLEMPSVQEWDSTSAVNWVEKKIEKLKKVEPS